MTSSGIAGQLPMAQGTQFDEMHLSHRMKGAIICVFVAFFLENFFFKIYHSDYGTLLHWKQGSI